jgi:hypothetical protein
VSVIVSLEDFLKTFNLKGVSYTASNAYKAYKLVLAGDSISYIERKCRVPKGTLYSWRSGAIPRFMKQVLSLEKKKLLPLTLSPEITDSSMLQYFIELYLYAFFSGHMHNCGNNSKVYRLSLSNTKDKLKETGEILKRVFKVNYKIWESNKWNSCFLTISSSRKDPSSMNQGLCRLLVSAGMPVGAKGKQELKIPGFIDNDSLLYYAIGLKGVVKGNHIRFKLFRTDKETARKNLNLIYKKLENSSIKFKTRIYQDEDGVMPVVLVEQKENWVQELKNMLEEYKPLYFI